MLVLSRKKDEKIIIGDDITLVVIEIRSDKVRLRIEAPTEISVHRSEVYEKILLERGITSILEVTDQKSGGKGMLVLSRMKDEKIIIGDDITVMVIEIRSDKVRLGIEAPTEISVHRSEVYDVIVKQKEAEVSPSP